MEEKLYFIVKMVRGPLMIWDGKPFKGKYIELFCGQKAKYEFEASL